MKTINYPKYRKPIVIVTLLHILLMLSFFFFGVTVIWYNYLFFGFFMFCKIEMLRYYTIEKVSKDVLMLGVPLSLMFIIIAPVLKNVYFSYICAGLFLFIMAFSLFKTIQRKSDNRKADYLIFSLLLVTFVFTLLISCYQMYLLIKPF